MSNTQNDIMNINNWEEKFDEKFAPEWNYRHVVNADTIKSFISSLLSEATKEVVEEEKEWPREGDLYWIFDGGGSVYQNTNHLWESDKSVFKFGNCFRTKKEAEAMRDKVHKLLKGN